MKLLFITVSFPPDIGPNARIINEIVEDHTALGHDVTVLCGVPHHPHMIIPPEYRGRLFFSERHGPADVLRTWVYAHPAKTAAGKILSYTSFMITAVLGGLKLKMAGKKFDFIFVISPPLLEGISGWVLGRVFRAPFLFNVQDIYPDIAVDHGVITSPALIRVLTMVERFIYRKAAVVSVICEGFRQTLMRKGVPEHKLVIVPNWVNTGFYTPGDRLTSFRSENGLTENDFVVLFAGTIGYSQGLTFMLQAAEELKDTPDIKFLIVGTGADKQTLVDYVRDNGLKNVVFHDPVPQARMPEVIATADASLVSLRKGKSTTTIPCKTYEVMASGRAILAAVDEEGDNWDLIRTANGGVHVEPENSASLASAIRRLFNDREAAAQYGSNGRDYAVAHCSRSVWTRFYHDLFRKITERGRSGA